MATVMAVSARAGDEGDFPGGLGAPPVATMPGVGQEPDTDVDPTGSRKRIQSIPFGYGTVIGPGGIVQPMPPRRRAEAPKKKVLTPQERAASISKTLTPRPPLAVSRRRTLDDLYTKLAAAGDESESKGLATLIGNIWMRSGSDTTNLLMQRVTQAIQKKNTAVALELLDKIVTLQPDWTEGWNTRASVRFDNGDLDGSMADVEHVLKLEPKHFGALEGMAMILQKTGLDKRALEIYRRALSIYPHQPSVQETVDKLTLQVEGQGI